VTIDDSAILLYYIVTFEELGLGLLINQKIIRIEMMSPNHLDWNASAIRT
jgi:hypothetical protein